MSLEWTPSTFFQEELQDIFQAFHVYSQSKATCDIEIAHSIERLLKTDIPALLTTYEALNETDKRLYAKAYQTCFQRMRTKIIDWTQTEQQDSKQQAEKILHLMEKRY